MQAHNRMLQSSSSMHCKEFGRHQGKLKMAIDNAKEEWIRKVTLEGEKATKDGQTRWKSIRKLQMAHAGRRPIGPIALLDWSVVILDQTPMHNYHATLRCRLYRC